VVEDGQDNDGGRYMRYSIVDKVEVEGGYRERTYSYTYT
jgi:hypothetical protein